MGESQAENNSSIPIPVAMSRFIVLPPMVFCYIGGAKCRSGRSGTVYAPTLPAIFLILADAEIPVGFLFMV